MQDTHETKVKLQSPPPCTCRQSLSPQKMPRAPRVRLKRIDAAIDAVRPMGFSEPLIRKTVRNLLKTYGGDEGWPFIEEFSYKLLIDSILEEAEEKDNIPRLQGNPEPVLMIENKVSRDNTNGYDVHSNQIESSRSESPPLKKRAIQVYNSNNNSSTLPITIPSSSKGEISCEKQVSRDNGNEYNVHSNQIESSRSELPPLKKRTIQVYNPNNNSSTLPIAVLCSSKWETSCGKQVSRDDKDEYNVHSDQIELSRSESPPLKKRTIQVYNPSNSSSALPIPVPCSSKGETSCGKQIALSKISAGGSSLQVKVCSQSKHVSSEIRCQLFSPPIVETRSVQRRKPCYGWISSDDDEEPD
ncbi:hypothetical protein M5689_002088 [Euphorbia peplus]|nr:hypothetical protein M5689_002088 [Euphorbia peplus]